MEIAEIFHSLQKKRMERLGDFVASVTRSLGEEHDGAVGEEFRALVSGIGYLKDAMKKGEAKEAAKDEKAEDGRGGEAAKKERADDGGEGEAAKEEKAEEEDIIAIAWRVEYDLTRYIE